MRCSISSMSGDCTSSYSLTKSHSAPTHAGAAPLEQVCCEAIRFSRGLEWIGGDYAGFVAVNIFLGTLDAAAGRAGTTAMKGDRVHERGVVGLAGARRARVRG